MFLLRRWRYVDCISWDSEPVDYRHSKYRIPYTSYTCLRYQRLLELHIADQFALAWLRTENELLVYSVRSYFATAGVCQVGKGLPTSCSCSLLPLLESYIFLIAIQENSPLVRTITRTALQASRCRMKSPSTVRPMTLHTTTVLDLHQCTSQQNCGCGASSTNKMFGISSTFHTHLKRDCHAGAGFRKSFDQGVITWE